MSSDQAPASPSSSDQHEGDAERSGLGKWRKWADARAKAIAVRLRSGTEPDFEAFPDTKTTVRPLSADYGFIEFEGVIYRVVSRGPRVDVEKVGAVPEESGVRGGDSR